MMIRITAGIDVSVCSLCMKWNSYTELPVKIRLLFTGKPANSNEIQPLEVCLRQRPDFFLAYVMHSYGLCSECKVPV